MSRLPHDSPNCWTVLWAWDHLTQNFLPLKYLSLASCLVGWKLQAVFPLDFLAIWKKTWELLRSILNAFPYTCVWVHKHAHVCVPTRFLSLCFQGEVCMPLVISSVLILPDSRPEMWLPCKGPNWEQSGKNKYSKSCLQDPKIMWSAKEAEMFA